MSNGHDTAPGDERTDGHSVAADLRAYLIGLGLATLLTALAVLAMAQMGVHLVFFLHITTGPDNVNNVMALAFGVLMVMLLIGGSLWIMQHLNHNMIPMDHVMQMQR
jgi:cytochrome o ubiquinol oxidase operon protein cyoD